MVNALIKVDPKAWFTNERTFLHWLNMAMVCSSCIPNFRIFLSMQILSIASLGSVASISYAVSVISLCLVGYTFYKYSIRGRELVRGVTDEARSDFLDIYSPIMVAGLLTIGVFLSILIAIQKWESSRYSSPNIVS